MSSKPQRLEDTTPRRIEVAPKTLVLVAAIVGACWITLQLVNVFLVLIVALFLVGTLNPAVQWLERRGVQRTRGIALAFTAMVLAAALLGVITIPSLIDQVRIIVDREPAMRNSVASFLSRSHTTAALAQSLREVRYDALAKAYASTALAFSTRAVEVIAYFISAVFLAFYIMIDRDGLRGCVFAAVPRSYHIRLSRVLLNLETIVGGYIRGQVLTSALMTAFVFVLLTVCGIPNALAIAVFAGVADVLPYIGVFLSIGPAAVAAASRGPIMVLVVVGVMLAYEEFESRVLVPRIYGRALRLPSSIVLLALLVGGALMGMIGALLALPFAAGIRMLIEELRVVLPGEQIDDTVLRDRDDRAEEEYERRAEGVPAEQAAAIAVEISDERRNEEGGPKEAVEAILTGAHAPPARNGEAREPVGRKRVLASTDRGPP